jgi:glycosyltransferase involved in cell wall biosynthesis
VIKNRNVKTVLFLSSWFPNRVTPTNGDFVERHALAISETCHTVVVHVTANSQIEGFFFEVDEIQNQNLTEYIIYFKRSRIPVISTLINNFYYGLGYFLGYRKMKKRHGKPDIIHANIIYPIGLVAKWISYFTGIPYIISEHWTLFLTPEGANLLQKPSVRKAVNGASFVVPVTINLQDILKKFRFTTRFAVVPNVVDTGLFLPSSDDHPDMVRFVHVSSMKEKHKNISGIIRAISRLRDLRSDFSFTFVGDATGEQKNLASELVSEGLVFFTGEAPHEKIPVIMRNSDVLVLFSRIENLPCVIPEAFACGLPVISSDVGGIREWINEKNGILVKSGNGDDLLKAMSFMMDHHKNYNKEELNQFARRHFSPTVIADRFMEIYNDALKKVQHD